MLSWAVCTFFYIGQYEKAVYIFCVMTNCVHLKLILQLRNMFFDVTNVHFRALRIKCDYFSGHYENVKLLSYYYSYLAHLVCAGKSVIQWVFGLLQSSCINFEAKISNAINFNFYSN